MHLRFLNLIPDKPSNNENTSLGPDLRVQFLEVIVDEPLLAHFDELARGSVEEVALRFQRAEIYLTDYLDDGTVGEVGEVGRGDEAVFGKGAPV